MPNPQTFTRAHASLLSCLKLFLPAFFVLLALGYAKTTFKKTKTSSHLSFLKQCLRLRVIPRGFLLHHSPSDPNNASLTISTWKILMQASRKLITAHIKTLQHEQTTLTLQLTHYKIQLSSILPPSIAQNIKTFVHTHNQLIYNHCKDTKDKKLANLCVSTKNPRAIPADNQPSQTKVNSELVRCIPDSLPLTESGRLVLSKGF